MGDIVVLYSGIKILTEEEIQEYLKIDTRITKLTKVLDITEVCEKRKVGQRYYVSYFTDENWENRVRFMAVSWEKKMCYGYSFYYPPVVQHIGDVGSFTFGVNHVGAISKEKLERIILENHPLK